MNRKELEILLEKYYNGLTTLKEEEQLRHLLASGDLPVEFYPDRDILSACAYIKDIPDHGEDLGRRIMKGIDESDMRKRITNRKRSLYVITSVAAGLLILIASYIIMSRQVYPEDTYSNPDLAYMEARRILLQVSEELNNGQDQLASLAVINRTTGELDAFSKAAKEAGDHLENIGYLERGLSLINLIDSPVEEK